MGFGDGDLHVKVEQLEREKTALEDQLASLKSRLVSAESALAIEQLGFENTRDRWTKRGAEIARQRGRIAELEQLVRDWAKVPCKCSYCEFSKGHNGDDGCMLLDRAEKLGITLDNGASPIPQGSGDKPTGEVTR